MQYLVKLIFALFVAVPTSLFAADFARGPYAGFELGRTFLDDQSATLAAAYNYYTPTALSQTNSVNSGRFFIGYKIHENVNVEVGYTQDQSFSANLTGTDGIGLDNHSVNTTYKARGMDYSLLFRPSIFTKFNGLFLRIGGHTSIVDSKTTDTDTTVGTASPTLSATTSNSGFFGGIGYDLKFFRGLSMRTEFTYIPNLGGYKVKRLSIGLKYAFE